MQRLYDENGRHIADLDTRTGRCIPVDSGSKSKKKRKRQADSASAASDFASDAPSASVADTPKPPKRAKTHKKKKKQNDALPETRQESDVDWGNRTLKSSTALMDDVEKIFFMAGRGFCAIVGDPSLNAITVLETGPGLSARVKEGEELIDDYELNSYLAYKLIMQKDGYPVFTKLKAQLKRLKKDSSLEYYLRYFQSGNTKSRCDHTGKLMKATFSLLRSVALLQDTEPIRKTDRGWYNKDTAAQLVPFSELKVYNKNPEHYRKQVLGRTALFPGWKMRRFLFDLSLVKKGDTHGIGGLLRNELIYIFFLHLYCGSGIGGQPNNPKKPVVWQKYHITEITGRQIAYTCCQMDFLFSSERDFEMTDDRRALVNFIIAFLEHPSESAAADAASILAYYNETWESRGHKAKTHLTNRPTGQRYRNHTIETDIAVWVGMFPSKAMDMEEDDEDGPSEEDNPEYQRRGLKSTLDPRHTEPRHPSTIEVAPMDEDMDEDMDEHNVGPQMMRGPENLFLSDIELEPEFDNDIPNGTVQGGIVEQQIPEDDIAHIFDKMTADEVTRLTSLGDATGLTGKLSDLSDEENGAFDYEFFSKLKLKKAPADPSPPSRSSRTYLDRRKKTTNRRVDSPSPPPAEPVAKKPVQPRPQPDSPSPPPAKPVAKKPVQPRPRPDSPSPPPAKPVARKPVQPRPRPDSPSPPPAKPVARKPVQTQPSAPPAEPVARKPVQTQPSAPPVKQVAKKAQQTQPSAPPAEPVARKPVQTQPSAPPTKATTRKPVQTQPPEPPVKQVAKKAQQTQPPAPPVKQVAKKAQQSQPSAPPAPRLISRSQVNALPTQSQLPLDSSQLPSDSSQWPRPRILRNRIVT